MSYENAPATQLVATNCACCGRPLVDAMSVEIGIGPDCRKKYGYHDGSENERVAANTLVHWLALNRNEAPKSDVLAAIDHLTTLGFVRLAEKVADKLIEVRIAEKAGTYIVHTPYNEAAIAAFRSVPGRRWNAALKANEFPMQSKSALLAALRKVFKGSAAVGPKGVFVI